MSASMARQAAMVATVPSGHIDRVVHSVTDATKRLSQISASTTTTTTQSSKRRSRDTIGPWKLGKTLGKGSSGRVRLAKNMETGKLAAVKIVPKAKSARSNALPYGIEREVIIMKLISHSNVMGLYEVWENKFELFLVLEYVDGGELFDYLVSRGRLPEKEAIHYFKQIIDGTAYCHGFNICHRDLKPENLLLDKRNKRIKIADFGMAALQTSNRLLETSCGSPHYASPEIVMGKSYHGGPSDVWSCGIILFALLTGHLPFNDDNIKRLLLKVQAGRFQMPQSISAEAKDLLAKMLIVDPQKRVTIQEILVHPLITKYSSKRSKSNSDLHLLSRTRPNIVMPLREEDVDPSILQNLQILWHSAPKEFILRRLLDPDQTEEKTFYALLLAYQQRQSNQGQDPVGVNAPRILQKSQFSVPSIKSQTSPHKEHVASSSRVFKSTSRSFRKRIHVSSSRKSLGSLASKESLAPVPFSASRKSVKVSPGKTQLPSKRSLYSLTSISKRSVNLKDQLHEDEQPPLPQRSEFESLCEKILFGKDLENIIPEEGTSTASEADLDIDSSLQQDISSANNSESDGEQASSSQVENKPPPSISKLKPTQSTRNLRITSAPTHQPRNMTSLDPRRNVSQPNSIEMLLNKYSLRANLINDSTSIHKRINRPDRSQVQLPDTLKHEELTGELHSNGTELPPVREETSISTLNESALKKDLYGHHNSDLPDEHSETASVRADIPRFSPSIRFNSSTTFKNLKQFMSVDAGTQGQSSSTMQRPLENSIVPGMFSGSLNVSRKASAKTPSKSANFVGQRSRKMSFASNNEGRSDMLSDMSFALDVPIDTFTAQAFHISEENFSGQSNKTKGPILLQEDRLDDDINVFEDAPEDNVSVSTNSSGVDSQPHVHRKATSIDTLNTNTLAPSADVRVSLYANNMTSSAKLPRETTEEILSKFRLSPAKSSAPPQKRFSYQRKRNSISQSVMSMFKDLDDEQDGNENMMEAFDGLIGGNDLPRDASGSLNEAVLNKEPNNKKRVTMLFDDDAPNVFKQSPIKVHTKENVKNAGPKQASSVTLPITFTKSKLDTVAENDMPSPPSKRPESLRPAPPPPSTVKETWFTKFFRSLNPKYVGKPALVEDHYTPAQFEVVHMLMLKEFGKNSIDYELKRLDKRGDCSRAYYNCRFIKGRFRFKIRIVGDKRGTTIHIKKKGQQDAKTFQKFNDDVAKVLAAVD
ncbi:LADA_0G10682g1_1 [Lachancea dasiensis]|uniref:non-specific serine/threonine protein kinase n=1 Tax=Lachancea dasiensis TaxID=1072105 RepID=A0A1G4JUX6_9SACH|nr:LADA_0G10682g1_1 [Lachancea dasiensis]